MKLKRIISIITVFAAVLFITACSAAERGDHLSTPVTEGAGTENAAPENARIGAAPEEEVQGNDIIILYTNDVHCGIDSGLGYSKVSAIRNEMLKKTPYVTLVDAGDHLQGEAIGVVSKGAYLVQIMNRVGYDYAVLGNHEFDYGLRSLNSNMMAAKYQYLDCNVFYTGKGNDPFFNKKSYEIAEYGGKKVAFIGVTTPETITDTNPANIKENGEIVVDFSGSSPEEFYGIVQKNIDECRAAGADHVILLTHLGIAAKNEAYGSYALIAATEGVDAVIDAHSHTFMCAEYVADRNGKPVVCSSTGTKLQSVGELIITGEGNIIPSLITSFPKEDAEVQAFIDSITKEYEAETGIPVGSTDFDLKITDSSGIRMVRSRETNLGDLCADAFREVLGAQTGWVNGGGVRDNIEAGDITFGNILKVSPFGSEVSLISAKGQHILDALEMASMRTEADYRTGDGKSAGENGEFAQVSGLKYTIDTSVPSSVVLDENGGFLEVSGKRRVRDVYVEAPDGTFEELDPEGYYTMAITSYISKNAGGGLNMFLSDEVLLDSCDQDYNIISKYITENLGGVIPERYRKPQGRITIE